MRVCRGTRSRPNLGRSEDQRYVSRVVPIDSGRERAQAILLIPRIDVMRQWQTEVPMEKPSLPSMSELAQG